jgi:ABC-type polysaccharide/polyol phosphate transport system ATPase subunit
MSTVIQVDNLSKKYVLRHQAGARPRYTSLRDELTHRFSSFFSRKNIPNAQREEFWALKDVSFSIQQGESVGIIGRNGAGKSTLLKLLSRITKPSKGRIEIQGRVASLLEVGTGFHAELTGRENIFLNGAIMGMPRAEIRRKFDEIVAFAEVEKFIDTPVKRYSSGMYMRLALLSMKCWPSATCSFKESAWEKWRISAEAAEPSFLSATTWMPFSVRARMPFSSKTAALRPIAPAARPWPYTWRQGLIKIQSLICGKDQGQGISLDPGQDLPKFK